MRRGLTMIELLVSLGILSAVTLTTVAWTQSAVRATRLAEPMRFSAAADAVLQLIHDDLATGDFELDESRRRDQGSPRATIVEGSLRIQTRAVNFSTVAGPVIHHYTLDRVTDELQLREEDATGRENSRILLDQVRDWDCAIDDENNVLTVLITSMVGRGLARSYRLP